MVRGGLLEDWSGRFLRANRARNVPGLNTALADLIDEVERWLIVNSRSGPPTAAAAGSSKEPLTSSATPPGRGGLSGSFADRDPLGSFIERWEKRLGLVSRRAGRDVADQVRLVDEATGLALLLCLLAASKKWVDLLAAARLAAKATRYALGEVESPKGALGDLLLMVAQRPAGSRLPKLLLGGLTHRALTAWVQFLDRERHPGTPLLVAVMRARADRIRRDLGEVRIWGSGVLPWGGIVDNCADLPAPDENESLVNELEDWIRDNPLKVLDQAPQPGTLLWKQSVGWGLSVGPATLGQKESFTVALVAEGDTLYVKPDRRVGWSIVAEQSLPDNLKPVRALTLEFVRQSTGHTR